MFMSCAACRFHVTRGERWDRNGSRIKTDWLSGMHAKMYRMRSLAMENGTRSFIDLDLEFEGVRAFVIWDTITLGEFQFKARLEIDPTLLQKDAGDAWDFLYRGDLVLPRPQNN
jgi:hypothetical protein